MGTEQNRVLGKTDSELCDHIPDLVEDLLGMVEGAVKDMLLKEYSWDDWRDLDFDKRMELFADAYNRMLGEIHSKEFRTVLERCYDLCSTKFYEDGMDI